MSAAVFACSRCALSKAACALATSFSRLARSLSLAASSLRRSASRRLCWRSKSAAALLEDFEPRVRPVHLVYDSQNRLPLKLRAFVDFVVPRLRQRLVDVTL
jgi:hypothetical protein